MSFINMPPDNPYNEPIVSQSDLMGNIQPTYAPIDSVSTFTDFGILHNPLPVSVQSNLIGNSEPPSVEDGAFSLQDLIRDQLGDYNIGDYNNGYSSLQGGGSTTIPTTISPILSLPSLLPVVSTPPGLQPPTSDIPNTEVPSPISTNPHTHMQQPLLVTVFVGLKPLRPSNASFHAICQNVQVPTGDVSIGVLIRELAKTRKFKSLVEKVPEQERSRLVVAQSGVPIDISGDYTSPSQGYDKFEAHYSQLLDPAGDQEFEDIVWPAHSTTPKTIEVRSRQHIPEHHIFYILYLTGTKVGYRSNSEIASMSDSH